MDELFTAAEAVKRYALPSVQFLKNATKTATGPRFLRPSPHKMLYRATDLEAWIASWAVHTPMGRVKKEPKHDE